jgi:hypothetical protein
LDLYRGPKLLGGMCCSVDPVTNTAAVCLPASPCPADSEVNCKNVTVNRLILFLSCLVFVLTPRFKKWVGF